MTQPSSAKDIFLDLIDHPPAEWDERLAKCCADDNLRFQVQKLLHAHRSAGSFLSTPTVRGEAHDQHAYSETDAILESPGSRVGQYTLVEELGEGGFGVVFRADQTSPVRRSVALKIIKPGMDTRQVVARLKAEQQVLAMLDHPHIAKVFDADTTETGRPFFVMELVDGVAITDFCKQHKLSLNERLGLFDLVCDAARHAHQKGIIHRDIKPNNVLVSGTRDRPVPKLIDFGVAKAMNDRLTDQTYLTHDHQVIGTPQYMSPEQAAPSEQDIDTRSDVYSLGVLLYEILTGSTPLESQQLRGAKLTDIQRLVCEEDPPRPSTRLMDRLRNDPDVGPWPGEGVSPWHHKLKGDLDTIVMKALHKNRERRYASVERLSDDVRRYLLGLPIAARGDSVSYRTMLFVKRNSTTVVAGFLVLFSLVGALISTYRSGNVAARQRDVAVNNLYDAYRAQARAAQSSKRPGRRSESMKALQAAAAIRPTRELRDQAIACMTLSDVTVTDTHGVYQHATTYWQRETDRFAYLAEDGNVLVKFLDAARQPLTLPTPHNGDRAQFWAFSPSGAYLAVVYSAEEHWNCVVWRVDAQEIVLEVTQRPTSCQFSFSPTEEWIAATTSENTVKLFELPSGESLRTLSVRTNSRAISLSPSSTFLAISYSTQQPVTIISLNSGETVASLACDTLINDLQWSPDGKRLAGAGEDHRIYLWDTTSWEPIRALIGHQGQVRQVFWHPSGDFLASNSWDNTSRIWNARSGEQLFDPLQSWNLQGFGDRFLRDRRGELTTWTFERSEELRRLYTEDVLGPIAEPCVHQETDLILTSGRNGLRFWDLEKGTTDCTIDKNIVYRSRYDDKDHILFVDSEGLKRWTRSRKHDGERNTKPWPSLEGTVDMIWPQPNLRRFDLARDRSMVAVCNRTSVHLVDLETRTARTLTDQGRSIIRPRLSPDNRWLFTGTWKGDPAQLWDLESETVILTFDGPHVIGDFSPDGQQLVVSRGADFRFLDVGTWKQTRIIDRSLATDDLAGKLAFSPDGSLVALGKSRYSLTLIDVATGHELAQLVDSSFLAQSDLVFTPDARSIVVATMDRVLQVWNLDRIRQRLRQMNLDW